MQGTVLLPSLCMLCAQAGAICLAYGTAFGLAGEIAAGAGLLAAALALAVPVWRRSIRIGHADATENLKRALIFCCALVMIAGAAAWRVRAITALRPPSLDERGALARVESCVFRRSRFEALLAFADPRGRDQDAGQALAYLPPDDPPAAGDTILLTGVRTRNLARPGNSYERSLRRRGITMIVYARAGNIRLVEKGTRRITARAQDALVTALDRTFSRRTAGLCKALFTGNSAFVSRGALAAYKEAGVLHILAASGFNVAIVAAIPFLLLGMMTVPKKALFSVSLLFVGAYLCCTDMPVSLVRACLMYACSAFHYLTHRRPDLYNALLLSAVLTLGLFPGELVTLGFQLSYAATLGILALFPFYRRAFGFLPGPAANSLALTCAAQAPVFPIIALTLGEVNCAGILANLIVVPLTTLFFALTPVALACARLPFCGSSAVMAMEGLSSVLDAVVCFFASWQGSRSLAGLPALQLLWLACALILFLLPAFPRPGSPRLRWPGVVCASLLCLLLPRSAETPLIVSHSRGRLACFSSGERRVIMGEMPPWNETAALARVINALPWAKNDLLLSVSDPGSLSRCARLLEKIPVTKCSFPATQQITPGFVIFCRMLEREGIPLVPAPPPLRQMRAIEACYEALMLMDKKNPCKVSTHRIRIRSVTLCADKVREDAVWSSCNAGCAKSANLP